MTPNPSDTSHPMAENLNTIGETLNKVIKQTTSLSTTPDVSVATIGRQLLSAIPKALEPFDGYLKDAITELQSKQELAREYSNLEKRAAALSSSLEPLKAEVDQLREEKKVHEATAAEIEQLRSASEALETELKQLRCEKEAHISVTAELQQLNEHHSELRSTSGRMEFDLRQLRVEMETHTAEFAELQQLRTELTHLRSTSAATTSELQEQHRRRQQEKETADQALAAAQTSNDDLRKELSSKEVYMRKMDEELHGLRSTVVEYRNGVKAAAQKLPELSQQAADQCPSPTFEDVVDRWHDAYAELSNRHCQVLEAHGPCADKIEELNGNVSELRLQVRDVHSNQQALLDSKLASQKESLEEQFTMHKKELNDDIARLNEKNQYDWERWANFYGERKALLLQLESDLEGARQSLASAENEHVLQVTAVQEAAQSTAKEHEEAVSGLYTELITAEDSHRKAARSAAKEHEEAVSALNAQLITAENAHREAAQATVKKHKAAEEKLRQEVDILNKLLEERSEDLATAKADTVTRCEKEVIDQIQEEISRMQAEYDHAIATLKGKHSDEIAGLTDVHDGEMVNLRNKWKQRMVTRATEDRDRVDRAEQREQYTKDQLENKAQTIYIAGQLHFFDGVSPGIETLVKSLTQVYTRISLKELRLQQLQERKFTQREERLREEFKLEKDLHEQKLREEFKHKTDELLHEHDKALDQKITQREMALAQQVIDHRYDVERQLNTQREKLRNFYLKTRPQSHLGASSDPAGPAAARDEIIPSLEVDDPSPLRDGYVSDLTSGSPRLRIEESVELGSPSRHNNPLAQRPESLLAPRKRSLHDFQEMPDSPVPASSSKRAKTPARTISVEVPRSSPALLLPPALPARRPGEAEECR